MKHNFNEHENNLINSNPEFKNIIDSIDAEYSMSIIKLTHEFGNALTLVNSSLQIIESSHPEVKRFKYWASTMGDVHYLVNLISELSFYNHSDKLNLETIDIVSLIQSVINSYKSTTSENVISNGKTLCNNITSKTNSAEDEHSNDKCNIPKIHYNLSCLTPIPEITADNTKLKQVFINLVKNAYEALDFSKSSPSICVELSCNNSNLTISIKDNGQGISPEHLTNIFSPMVSYKSNGTGLGLPISKKIIESHNGTISVDSAIGIGTTFIITLPV
ncbi:sensor histidine kinase [Bovifimicola ammoniilytica]|uniref:sensor histidine kinase n=1 Tax=Bovifimicola ammoniilytica TaxID=2981720 RepID=UPI0008230249|nr:HAMP domain-containing sensor histidine kinase [Bovifimicola ammoniilytica]MCU6754179.1 HAMP domain-containing histidine kinase [Bovifimicola ammoniilytica]SCJ81464.1 Sensor protein ZraS [uncultured Eubacterium sp.]